MQASSRGSFLWIVLALWAGCELVARYLYRPLKARPKRTVPLRSACVPVEPTDLPAGALPVVQQASGFLNALGFRSLGQARMNLPTAEVQVCFCLWANDLLGDVGELTVISVASRIFAVATFETEFPDGTSINTSNTPIAGIFPADPRENDVACPPVWDLALLYRFHRARVQRDRGIRCASLQRFQDILSHLRLVHDDTYTRLTVAGYYTVDQARQRYVPTYKGALLMAYRVLPPWRQIRRFKRDRRADKVLRELGFGGLTAFRRSQSPNRISMPLVHIPWEEKPTPSPAG